MSVQLSRIVVEAGSGDAGRGIVRLDPADLKELLVPTGGIVEISAKRATYARALPSAPHLRGKSRVSIDGAIRANAKALLQEPVSIKAVETPEAAEVAFAVQSSGAFTDEARRRLSKILLNRPVVAGDQIRLSVVGGGAIMATVNSTVPAGPVVVTAKTSVSVTATGADKAAGPSYDDLGGLQREIARVREMVELPIRRPDLFQRLGIEAPKGVLLSGPPGTGKTLLARALAAESGASFHQIDGPEIISRHYGDSEAHLRAIFEKAEAQAPAIIFIDEIDAIAPKRMDLGGDRQLERRVVAQLLTLMDGLSGRGQVVVIAATNMPDALDTALRRPGRFDREIRFNPPDKAGRRQILEIQTEGVPLAHDVDLDSLAAATHGFVGADLAALVREAGMTALRRHTLLDASRGETSSVDDLYVEACDFESARTELIPSALREVYTEIADVSWADIGGHHEIKRALTEAVEWPLKFPDLFRSVGVRPAKGVILSGPPGTGKTRLARALATEAKVNFISVRGPELLDKFLGESERAIRETFERARSLSPCVLFFDEIDALAPKRTTAGAALDRVVAQLLTEIDGIVQLSSVFMLAATNRIDILDPALLRPGRFDLSFEIGLPDTETRRAILAVHARGLPLLPEVDLERIAANTEGFTGADLEAVLQGAGRVALSRYVEESRSGALSISGADVAAALGAVMRARRSETIGRSS